MIRKIEKTITPFASRRTIHFYLPDDYEKSDEYYPVLYMFDGHNLFRDEDATYGKSWGMADFLDKSEKKFIVVGLECDHAGMNRLSEYCPYEVEKSLTGAIHGRGKELMEWVADELKPWVDLKFRTQPFRECTMIGGSSMGGLMALYTVLHYNPLFSKAACLSPSLSICRNAVMREVQESELSADTRIYMDWGEQEFRQKRTLAASTAFNLELAHRMQRKGARVYPRLIPGGEHNEATWSQQIPAFMRFLWEEA